jgi:hypothetical protein
LKDWWLLIQRPVEGPERPLAIATAEETHARDIYEMKKNCVLISQHKGTDFYSGQKVVATFGNKGFFQIDEDANSLALTLNSLIRPCWSVYATVLSALSTSCEQNYKGHPVRWQAKWLNRVSCTDEGGP